jgi:PAS domain S-box-containing protein
MPAPERLTPEDRESPLRQRIVELTHHLEVARAERLRLSDENAQLTHRIADLEKLSASVHESRRAALNVMEDAVRSNEIAETLNTDLKREISVRERAEAALRGSEDRLRTLADAVPQIIWANDADGPASYFNRRWYDYTGLTYEQSVGLGWEAIVHPDDAPVSKRKWQQAFAASESFDCEYRLRRADDAYRWFIGRNVPLRNLDGHISGWFGSATDIQDLKEAQAVAQEREQQLLKAFQETDRARAEAEAATRAKDHFLAVLSHELRTPLTPVLMATGTLVRRDDLPEAMRDALTMIRRNVQLEAQLVDDLLDVSRIVHGKMELMRVVMDMHEVINRAAEITHPEIQSKRQQLVLSLAAERHHLNGDPTRLQQVVWNLINNASKFSPEGSEINLRTYNATDCLIMEISDEGIGIEPEAAIRIFDAFAQANAMITREFGGLGLGLSIAKATVDAHGGTLRVESKGRDQGATFIVSLPTDAGS